MHLKVVLQKQYIWKYNEMSWIVFSICQPNLLDLPANVSCVSGISTPIESPNCKPIRSAHSFCFSVNLHKTGIQGNPCKFSNMNNYFANQSILSTLSCMLSICVHFMIALKMTYSRLLGYSRWRCSPLLAYHVYFGFCLYSISDAYIKNQHINTLNCYYLQKTRGYLAANT